MYIVTFYSFKGGTGRSMALVNAAVELVRAGRRVLIVDFDLEAPGLDTFNLPGPQSPTKGIVDFVLKYLETAEAPDVAEYLYRSPIVSTNGQLWVMPSGVSDDSYDERFKSINWQDLYDNRDGYLLFEDLKLQWNRFLQPDYVFIDSRTGHTDVGGICTRQLPNAVALFFFPNEQNRRGLESVVRQIRTEAKAERKKDIKLHFVMSNVPELDDEDEYLAKNVAKFRATLGFRGFLGTIHHYPSLALVTQSIFTLDHPKTRLAQEYRRLARAIRRENPEDPEAAIEFLDEIAAPIRSPRLAAGELEDRLKDIRIHHPGNLDVLVRLAAFFRRQRRFEEALALLEEAGDLGVQSSEFLLMRAELNSIARKSAATLSDLTRFLETTDATYVEVSAATRLLVQLGDVLLKALPNSTAFCRLDADGQYYVSQEMLYSRKALPIAETILRGLVRRTDWQSHLKEHARTDLALALIGQSRYGDALIEITQGGQHVSEEFEIQDAFNYAMAQWGSSLKPTPELFKRVLDLAIGRDFDEPNVHQCLAIAYWAINDTDAAMEQLGEALQHIMTRPTPTFSCWSYLRVSPSQFQEELKIFQHQLIQGEPLVPQFLTEGQALGREVKQ